MRRRMLTSILLFALIVSSLIAAKQDTFEISAYKIGESSTSSPEFALYVVDSVYGSFLEPSAPSGSNIPEIDVTDKVKNLFGSTDRKREATFNRDTMAFHVVAMGNQTGHYEIDISFGKLTKVGGSEIIDTSYTMSNARGNFSNSLNSITENGNSYGITSADSFIRPYDQIPYEERVSEFTPLSIKPASDFTGSISESENGQQLQLGWYVYNQNEVSDCGYSFWNPNETMWQWQPDWVLNQGQRQITPMWIVRTAVAMTIDEASYENSSVGEYSATVVVTFKQIS